MLKNLYKYFDKSNSIKFFFFKELSALDINKFLLEISYDKIVLILKIKYFFLIFLYHLSIFFLLIP